MHLDAGKLTAWRMFITAHAALVEKIDDDLRAANQIPLHWYDVLIELAEAHDKRLRMSDLADSVVLSRSGLTRLVDKLETAGLLRRERSSDDGRGAYAVITDAGVEALRSAWKIYATSISAYFGDFLSDDEAALLAVVFTKMFAHTRK